MLEALKTQANLTLTENGAVTHATTHSDCLDLFAAIGALRRADEGEVFDRFLRAFAEDPDLAMKLLFFARDVRGGLGERRVFRGILARLAFREPEAVGKNIPYIPEYGRFDDLLTLLGTPCEPEAIACIRLQLQEDLAAAEKAGGLSLLAKWLPSVNASCPGTVAQAKRLARALGMDDAAYRKTLSRLRARIRILENSLRERDYSFDYEKQPSQAMQKYRKAFLRNDGERYRAFLEQVSDGKAALHTAALTPYELIAPFFQGQPSEGERRAIDVAWNAQEDYTNGENALVVVDGSGSMYGGADPLPAAVAMSLGIYFAQRNRGAFHGHFITFSQKPWLVQVKGRDIYDQVQYCMDFNEVANTNLQKVFELILSAAVKHQVPREEMPSTLYIISDMEFDSCTDGAELTNFEYARRIFARRGYTLPRVVFWNVDSRGRQQPVTQNEQGVALVSGCSPRVFALLRGGALSPLTYMMEILGGARYA